MSSARPARMSGSVFCILGTFLLFQFLPNLLAEDLFAGHEIIRTNAKIISMSNGTRNRFPFVDKGIYYCYKFELGEEQSYQGQYFVRGTPWRNDMIGNTINVEYRADRPGINRPFGEGDLNWPIRITMVFFAIVAIIIGVIMLITGRDFISDWKQHSKW